MIPYGKQDISKADIDAVVEVLTSDFLTQGPKIDLFEKNVADFCGAKYAVAVSSATAALHIACLAEGLTTNDILWTSPISFVASANCGLYTGASVNFVDIDPSTYNMSIENLKLSLKKASIENKLPKVLIPVHFAGQSCDMEEIFHLSREYGFKIIEDASHAIGGYYKGKAIGNCSYSDMTVFSFHPVKIITTGEGGMILTNNDKLYQLLLRLRTHGITRNPSYMTNQSHGAWYYEQIELGYNYRITDLQAALGVSQLQRIEEFVNRRNFLAKRYSKALKSLPLVLPTINLDCVSSYHLYVVQLSKKAKIKRNEFFDELRSSQIGVNVHYIPIHLQPFYKNFGFKEGDFPIAESYYNQAISLPLYPGLTETDQDFIISTIERLLT